MKSIFIKDAWTETDNTVYTLSCAGTEGFLNLLPVYLDHILFPTLTKSAFITEVYSVTGTGDDNGAVYCEMQGRENSGESRCHLELLRNSYPNHGYSMETGGIMKNIRDSLTIEKIRDYHKQYYRAENLAVIIAGKVEIDEIEKAIKPIEQKILKRKDSYPKFVKPWQTPVKPLVESKDVKILFPSDEEEYGIVYIAFHGPQATLNYETLTACYILMKYLCDTSVSPVQQTFIEIEDPYASSVSYHISENSTSLLYFSFENVPIDKIDSIKDRLAQLFADIANGVEKIDENRLKIVFEKYILERLSSLEHSPHDEITFKILGDFLYADKKEDFAKRLNVSDIISELQKKPLNYWLSLLREFYVDNKSVTVRAVPSISEKEKLAQEDTERIEKRRKELGEDGLKQKEIELENAMKENDQPPSIEMLTSLPVPSTKSINFHSLDIFKKGQKTDKVDLSGFPFYIEAYNIKSNFIYVCFTFDSSELSIEMRKYLSLFLDLIVESPIKIGDKLISYEEVVAALEEDMISYDTSLGIQCSSRFGAGPFPQTATFHMQVEARKFEIAIGWMTNLFFNTIFTKERIHIIASKLVNDIASSKRDGYGMTREILKAIYFKKNSNSQTNAVLSQNKFLDDIIEKLKNPEQCNEVIDNLNKLRDLLVPTVTVHVAANFDKIQDLKNPMKTFVEKVEKINLLNKDRLNAIFDSELMSKTGNIDGDFTGTVVGIGCVESGYLFCSSPGIYQ
jgi:Zn-dependent M16 (insulinase) family peptidase